MAGFTALVADAFHSLNDAAARRIALSTRHIARRAPDEQHTFSYERVKVIGGLINLEAPVETHVVIGRADAREMMAVLHALRRRHGEEYGTTHAALELELFEIALERDTSAVQAPRGVPDRRSAAGARETPQFGGIQVGDYLIVLALAALPAAGNFAGGLLAEFVPLSDKRLSFALHAAAGIVLAVVGVELMGQVLQAEPPWIALLAFVAGGGVAIGLDRIVDLVRSRFGGSASRTGAWMIYAGVTVDLFSDGLLIGTGSTLSVGLGLLLALGQMPADVPEGFATIATFRRLGLPRRSRLLLAASFALPILLAASLGFWAVRQAPDIYKLSLLALTAGVLITVTVEEMITQAHATEDTRWDTMALVGGFALFALISVYLEP